MRQIKKKRTLLMTLAAAIIFTVFYNIYDNKRFVIKHAEVKIDKLPEELEGFTVLQISDLHEKQFGRSQDKVIESINNIKYDIIVFTGDMINHENGQRKPFYDLLDGKKNKTNAFFAMGNSDPMPWIINASDDTMYPSLFIKEIEERGLKYLERPYEVEKNGVSLWVMDPREVPSKKPEVSLEMLEKDLKKDSKNSFTVHEKEIVEKFVDMDKKLDANSIIVGVTHVPITDMLVNSIKDYTGEEYWRPDYSLIIAGHYHGGQIRIPLIGALYVPGDLPRNGFFPDQRKVKGLMKVDDMQQYVSAGLGASGAGSPLHFRLFNTPEINVIKFTGK